MVARAWPFANVGASLPRVTFRWGRDIDDNRRRAEIERAFRVVDDAFSQIDARLTALEIATNPAYGGMTSGGTPVAGADITTAWQQVVGFTSNLGAVKDVEVDLPNSRLRPARVGTYLITFSADISHNPDNGGVRQMQFRIKSSLGPVTPSIFFSTGKALEDTNAAETFTLAATTVGGWLTLEVSAPGVGYTAVNWNDLLFQIVRIGDT